MSSAGILPYRSDRAEIRLPPERSRAVPVAEPAVAQAPATSLALAVIIPTLNEYDNVPVLIEALARVLDGIAWEAVFVDDGSTDGTRERIVAEARRRPNVRLIRRFGRRGLSSAVIEGMMATTAPVVAVIDGDMQHDEAALPALFHAVSEGGADVAVGTRYAAGGSVGEWDRSRVRASVLASRLARVLTRTPLSDPMSGFFVIRQAIVIDLLPRLSTVGFKILLDIVASSPVPLRIAEVPYRFRSRAAGTSKLDASVALDYALLLLDKTVGRWIPPRFILFAGVGSLGLVFHVALLSLVLTLDRDGFKLAQTVAVAVTIALNFVLNNALTYRDRQLRGAGFWRGLVTFYLVCGLGAVANVGIGSLLYADRSPWWLAGLAGAALGALWNYTASSLFTWKRG